MKKILTAILTTACILTMTGCEGMALPEDFSTDTAVSDIPSAGTSNTSQSQESLTAPPAPVTPAPDAGASASGVIGEAKAREIALAHAQLSG